jgi:hypothetical protein
MQLINQYSMLWGGVLILGFTVFMFFRKGFKARDGIILLVLTIAIFAIWMVIRPDQANTSELAEFQSQIGQGQAVLVEMQSPY